MSQFVMFQNSLSCLQFPGMVVITDHQMEFCTLENSTDYQKQDHQIHTSLPELVPGLPSHAGLTFCIISILLRNSEGAECVGLTQYHGCFMEVLLSKIPNFDLLEKYGYFNTALSEILGPLNIIASLVIECIL